MTTLTSPERSASGSVITWVAEHRRHHLHHADPTCARHGVRRGQIDMSARLIRVFEKLGWASQVRWPTPIRLASAVPASDR